MADKKNYAPSTFVKARESQYGTILSIGIKRPEFIAWLKTLPENKNGFVNLQASSQKTDPTKWSVWEDTYVPVPRNVEVEDGNELHF
jgi:hypothetical protein